MKTAQEWIKHHATAHPFRAVTVEDISEIQLDAMKEGMRLAAEIVTSTSADDFGNLSYCKATILEVTENLTTSDL